MNMRGKWVTPIDKNSLKLNVTSDQSKNNENRFCFSPMTNYKGFWNFESYWQSGKVYKDIPEEITKKYWKNLKEPKRRYPGSKNKQVLYANFGDNKQLDYIISRKQIYVPEYYNLVKDNQTTQKWINKFKEGNNITIYDFDGTRDNDGNPICLEVTNELLCDKINDTKYPFGHGYVVSSIILGIDYMSYI